MDPTVQRVRNDSLPCSGRSDVGAPRRIESLKRSALLQIDITTILLKSQINSEKYTVYSQLLCQSQYGSVKSVSRLLFIVLPLVITIIPALLCDMERDEGAAGNGQADQEYDGRNREGCVPRLRLRTARNLRSRIG